MEQHKNIAYQPTDGLCYDPTEKKYWDSDALDKEIRRTFEICHGCRLCFKYCDSFPTLFSLLDEKHNGDVRRITASETGTIMDATANHGTDAITASAWRMSPPTSLTAWRGRSAKTHSRGKVFTPPSS